MASFRSILFTAAAMLAAYGSLAQAQLINGQYYTAGLAIIDAPAPNTPFQAGANMPIAVEMSGDGKLPAQSYSPNSSETTAFLNFQIYLVSSQTNTNITISNGTDAGNMLAQEPGSTVKHLNFLIPTCLAAGPYNITYYELSRINNSEYYTITPLALQISNPHQNTSNTGNCTALAPPAQQPQPASPPQTQPFLGTLNNNTGSASSAPDNSGNGGFTGTASPSLTLSFPLGLLTAVLALMMCY